MHQFLMSGVSAAAFSMASAAMAATPASAQSAATPPVAATQEPLADTRPTAEPTIDQDAAQIGDIVVTAQRRSESLQRVPIAVSALDAATLVKTGVANVLDIAAVTPGVMMTEFNVGEPQTYIRGVGSQTDSAASESSVTVAMDEVSIGRGGASPAALLDVQRVEVLRGPQGTLYGRNASAGVVAFYANAPQDRFAGYVEGSYGSFETVGGKLMLNSPLAPDLAVRVAAQYSHSDGFARNIRTGERLQGGERYAGRVQLRWRSGGLTALLSVDGARDDLTGDSRYGVGAPDSVPFFLNLTNVLQAKRRNVWESEGVSGTFQRRTNYGLLGRLDYETDALTISSLTAYRNNDVALRADYGGLAAPFPFIIDDRVSDRSHQFSQELRLSSPAASAVNWVAGLFYYDDRVDRTERFVNTVNAPLPLGLGGDNTGLQRATSTSYAAFGQATIPLAPIVKLTLGARLTHDRKEVFQQAIRNAPAGPVLGFPFFPGTPYAVTPEASFTKPTWRATLAVEPDATKNFYFSYDRGYKSGTFTSQAQNAAQAMFLVEPERIDSFNLGAKTQWLNRKLRVNVDAFYIDYRDLQVFGFGRSLNFVLSSADARIKGIEADVLAVPAQWFRAGTTFAYLDAEFTSNPSFAGATLAYEGNRLPRAPRYKVAPFAEANAPLWGGDVTARVNLAFTDDFFYNPSNDLASRQESYSVLGAFLSWTDRSGLTLSLTGTNLLSERYSVHNISFQNMGFRIFAPPRAVTFTASKRF